MSSDYLRAEFEPIAQPTPFADIVEVQFGYAACNVAYLSKRAQALRDSELRQSLSGITYETPVADSVENFLRMPPDCSTTFA